jgi:hypothetical protein
MTACTPYRARPADLADIGPIPPTGPRWAEAVELPPPEKDPDDERLPDSVADSSPRVTETAPEEPLQSQEPGAPSLKAVGAPSQPDVAALIRNPAVEEAIRAVEQDRVQIRQMLEAVQLGRPIVPPALVERARALIAPPGLQALVDAQAAAQRDMLARFRAIATPPSVSAIQGLQQRLAELADAKLQILNSAAMKALSNYQNLWRERMAQSADAFNRLAPALGAFVAEQAQALIEGRSPLHWALGKELSARGWWLAPTWPVGLLTQLGRGITERHGRRVIDEILLTHYRYGNWARLSEALRRWTEPEFDARQKTFREALAHHRKRRFRVAIVMLTPHIEGVVKEFLITEGLLTPEQARRRATPGLVEKHLARTPRQASHPGFVQRLERMYIEFTWGVPSTGRAVARHSILHGATTAPNSEIESLQLFLMLDTLHYFLSDLRVRRRAQRLTGSPPL